MKIYRQIWHSLLSSLEATRKAGTESYQGTYQNTQTTHWRTRALHTEQHTNHRHERCSGWLIKTKEWQQPFLSQVCIHTKATQEWHFVRNSYITVILLTLEIPGHLVSVEMSSVSCVYIGTGLSNITWPLLRSHVPVRLLYFRRVEMLSLAQVPRRHSR